MRSGDPEEFPAIEMPPLAGSEADAKLSGLLAMAIVAGCTFLWSGWIVWLVGGGELYRPGVGIAIVVGVALMLVAIACYLRSWKASTRRKSRLSGRAFGMALTSLFFYFVAIVASIPGT